MNIFCQAELFRSAFFMRFHGAAVWLCTGEPARDKNSMRRKLKVTLEVYAQLSYFIACE